MDNSAGGRASAVKTVTCRACGRTLEISAPQAGHPYGWYSLSVNVPSHLNSVSGRPYRWVGLFCSVSCLVGHEAELRSQRALMRRLYEPE